jgi:hypothetical protein
MNPKEIVDCLHPDRFEPFVIVTSSGERYEVRHSELARVMANGTIYVFEPSTRDDAQYESVVRIGHDHIASIEPLKKQTT